MNSKPLPQDAARASQARSGSLPDSHRVDLPDAMRSKMENAFGADLSAVKLYESQSVADAGARAVTRGSNIAFAPGMLDFSSYGGQALLGHEISHVVSQARGEVTGGGFRNDQALETRADREGAMAAAGQQIYAAPVTGAMSSVSAAHAAGPMQAKKSSKEDKQASRMARMAERSRNNDLTDQEREQYNRMIDNSMASPKMMQAIYRKQAEKRQKEMSRYGTYQNKSWDVGKKYSSQDRYENLLDDIRQRSETSPVHQALYQKANTTAMRGDPRRRITGLEHDQEYQDINRRWDEGGWRANVGHTLPHEREAIDSGWVTIDKQDEDFPQEFREETKKDAYRFLGLNRGGDYEKWTGSLDPAEKKGLADYTKNEGEGNYTEINGPLRERNPEKKQAKMTPKVVSQIQAMDSGLAKGNLKQPMIVHRGSGAQLLGGRTDPKKIMKALGGKTVSDPAFMSTSAVKGSNFGGEIQYRIRVPRGKGKGAFIAPLSAFKNEDEFLLQRNAPLIVRQAYKGKKGQTIVELEMKEEEQE